MTIRLTDINGLPMDQALSKMLGSVYQRLQNVGKTISTALTETTRRHVETIYPGSSHWNPNKITPGNSTSNTGETNIDIPGASRAYHDIDIVPKYRKFLTIPISSLSYGKKANSFQDTFVTFKKNGVGLIGQNNGGTVTWLYRLVKKVHQPQDQRLLPRDDTYATNIFGRISASLFNLR